MERHFALWNWVWVDRLGVFALDAGVSAAVLWTLAALVLPVVRQPARRLWLARATTVGSLMFLPLIGFDIVPQYDLFAFCERAGLFSHPLSTPRPAGEPSEAAKSSELGPTHARDGAAASSAVVGVWPLRGVTLAYVAGATGGLAWLAIGCAGLAWLTWASRAPAAGSLALLAALPYPRWRRRPRLRVAARVRRPVLVGLARPTILIPPALDRPEARDRLRLCLLHELAHAEAGDAGFLWLVNLAQALWFFVPPIWWLGARIRLDQEFLADRRAAAGYGPTRAYASSLLELAAPGADAPRPAARVAEGVSAGGSPLVARVVMLLRCPFPVESRPPALWSWGLSWLAVPLTLGVATLTFRYPESAPADAARPRAFRVSRVDVSADLHGRSPRVDLPIRIPARFDLTVEVWGDLPTLARMRIAGLALRSARLDEPRQPARWRLVRLRRDDHGDALWIDGDPGLLEPDAPRPSGWLALDPAPDRPAHYRRLVIAW